jgi:hypothetical protein
MMRILNATERMGQIRCAIRFNLLNRSPADQASRHLFAILNSAIGTVLYQPTNLHLNRYWKQWPTRTVSCSFRELV